MQERHAVKDYFPSLYRRGQPDLQRDRSAFGQHDGLEKYCLFARLTIRD
jgi:hypothetical protein